MMKVLLVSFLTLSLALNTSAQINEFESWKKKRLEEMTSEDGWINLAGLVWMDKDKRFLNQTAEDSLDLSILKGKKNIGSFRLGQDSVWFEFNPKVLKKSGIGQSSEQLIYPPVEYGKGGITFDHWKWTVIQRGGQYAVRLRDLTHPGLKAFQGIPVFDYDSNFRIKAFFEPRFNQTMEIPNVLGQLIEWKVMGILKFEIQGQSYQLLALDEAGKLFVIFSDESSGNETYPTGRYLYVNYPDKSGMTEIDFNFAYNPPCAFTAFATCPIPPKINRIPLALRVGEKVPDSH